MSKTEENLQEAFAGESQANRKYLAFAKKADEVVIATDFDREALNRLEIDTYGLDEADVKFLRTIMEKFDGGPPGGVCKSDG